MSPPSRVVLFDVDRTLIDIHTAKLYWRFQRDLAGHGSTFALRMRNAYWLLQYSLGIISAPRAAQHFAKDYTGKTETSVEHGFETWFSSYVRPWVSAVGRERVLQYQVAGHHVALATSLVRPAVAPLARELSIEHLICSELVVSDGKMTGAYQLPLCFGVGKLERAVAMIDSVGGALEHTAFYSDSITDLPLLEAVGYPVAVNPDGRLRRVARQRGWPIEEWLHAHSVQALPVPDAIAADHQSLS